MVRKTNNGALQTGCIQLRSRARVSVVHLVLGNAGRAVAGGAIIARAIRLSVRADADGRGQATSAKKIIRRQKKVVIATTALAAVVLGGNLMGVAVMVQPHV
jgi:hypothetical protein